MGFIAFPDPDLTDHLPLMPLRVGPLPWLTLRAAVGFGCAELFVATESWLNAKAEPAQRGRVFSAYMFGRGLG